MFKYYNNSYLYVTFRKPYLKQTNSTMLAKELLKITKEKIKKTFYKESELHNNKTKYDALREFKKKQTE